jgi:signal peptidase I
LKVPDMNTLRRLTRNSLTARLLRYLGNAAVALVLLISLAFILPSLLGFERYVITGGSMSGTFEKGSVAFEKPVPVADLAVGDVITYLPPADSGLTTLVTHRIVSKKLTESGAYAFRTKGDANAAADPWKFELGSPTQPRVEYTVPAIGYLFIALADRETRMLIVGIPAGLIALYSLAQAATALRENHRTRHQTTSNSSARNLTTAGAGA